MRVFVAGATGVIGRPLVACLVRAGHRVTGLTRSAERAAVVRAAGAEPVVGDALDAAGLGRLVAAARPEVVVHELTDIPKAIDPRRYARQFAGNDRLRTEGTLNLVRAAREAGARRVVAQSIAFAYAPEGGPVKDEEAPLYLDADPPFRRSVEAVRALEAAVLGGGSSGPAAGLEGVVLRYGYFYGPGTVYAADGSVAELARKRRLPIVGGGAGLYSFVHVDDAAEATRLAVEGGAPGVHGVYNVVDDEPIAVREWLPLYAQAIGAPRPFRVPAFLARWLAGSLVVYGMTRQRGAANAKAKRALGWWPAHASVRTGFREVPGEART